MVRSQYWENIRNLDNDIVKYCDLKSVAIKNKMMIINKLVREVKRDIELLEAKLNDDDI